MPSRAVKLVDLDGLYPNLDPRRVNKAHVIGGSNFIWNFDGPYSGLGYSTVSSSYTEDLKLGDAKHVHYADVGGLKLVFCENGVFEFSELNRTYTRIHQFSASNFDVIYKWHIDQVGGFYYVAHAGLSTKAANGMILKIDPAETTKADIVSEVETHVPVGALSLTAIRGRLIVLGTSQYAWSALTAGDNLTPNLITGAGAQGLSILGGDAYDVEKTPNGFFVFTSEGVITAQYYQGPGIFTHRILQDDVWANSHLCIVSLQAYRIVALTNKGLMVSDGDLFQRYSEIMSDYFETDLYQNVHPQANLLNFALHYDNFRSQLWVSISNSPDIDYFDYALVQNIYINKWGNFSGFHYLCSGADTFCFVNPNGTLFSFNNQLNKSERLIGPVAFGDFMLPAGQALDSQTSLDSSITVGSMRFTEQELANEVGLVTQLVIGHSHVFADTFCDWGGPGGYPGAEVFGDEDWLIDTASDGTDITEDWGFNVAGGSSYTVDLIGTLDAEAVHETANDRDGSLTLAEQTPAANFYGCQVSGIYHNVKITTRDEFNSFWALATIDITGDTIGRLY